MRNTDKTLSPKLISLRFFSYLRLKSLIIKNIENNIFDEHIYHCYILLYLIWYLTFKKKNKIVI